MIRTQIQLHPTQARRLRAYARRQGISMAEAIRRCVDLALPEDETKRADLYQRAAMLVGSLVDQEQISDLSAEHDRHLEEAFG